MPANMVRIDKDTVAVFKEQAKLDMPNFLAEAIAKAKADLLDPQDVSTDGQADDCK